jgi:plasmid stabilization system protein ParE
MKLIYHRLAVRDVREVVDYYESEAGTQLADRFFGKLLDAIGKIQSPALSATCRYQLPEGEPRQFSLSRSL